MFVTALKRGVNAERSCDELMPDQTPVCRSRNL
jgi:hypothetical protein